MPFIRKLSQLTRSQRGAELLEYSILATAIALLLVLGVTFLGTNVRDKLKNAEHVLFN